VPDVVVPYRAAGKTRLPPALRGELGRAMLEDVVAAALELGAVLVVTDDPGVVPAGAAAVADPGGGQGAAVHAALQGRKGHVLVVNADLPCATGEALRRLAGAGPALVAAADGTTNALSLPDPALFRPCYGAGSAAGFAALGLIPVELPELEHDVDSLTDLDALPLPLGRHTRFVADRHTDRGVAVR
jgi:2-phospho-L-lactate guanylyltransferase (CobY/MobA/RfbA family)